MTYDLQSVLGIWTKEERADSETKHQDMILEAEI